MEIPGDKAMSTPQHYTVAHWGTYEVRTGVRGPWLSGMAGDPDPSPIGLHQLAPDLDRVRVRHPAVRKSWLEQGPGARPDLRGKEAFVEIGWDEAARLVGDDLDRVRRTFGNQAIFGGSYGWASAGRFHHAQSQIHRFLNVIGGYVAHRDSYSLAAARVLLPHVVAPMNWLMNNHNSWDDLAENCDLFVAFGGVPVKNAQISQAGVGRHRVREGLQRMAGAGVEFVNISPIRDNLETGGPVDWLPVRPGGDTALMLGLAHEIRRLGGHDRAFLDRYCTGWDIFEAYLIGDADGCPKSPDWAAPLCGLSAEDIRALARRMITGKRVMLNIAWALQRAEHGEQPFWMLVTLAAMLGQIGRPGGGFGVGYGAENLMGSPHAALSGPSLPQGVNAVRDFIPVARIADMLLNPGGGFRYDGDTYRYPDIRLIYWAGGNPFHHHQDLKRLERAWQKPETIIVHEQSWTATARRADIVLPASTTQERDDLGYATMEGMLIASRQVRAAPGLAESDYDIFSRIAGHMGLRDAFTCGRSSTDWIRSMYDSLQQDWARAGVELPGFDVFWEQGRVDLTGFDPETRIMLSDFRAAPLTHPLTTRSGRIEIFCRDIADMDLPDCKGHPVWIPPGEWLGGTGPYPLHLISDQPARRLHSQLDASPHSVAGKIDGREPVSMNPADALCRGIVHGDVVEIFNDRGLCQAAAVPDPGIAPGILRLSTGAWYDPCPETGTERHGNPNVLTADRPASELSQGCTAHSCLVDIRPANVVRTPSPFEGPDFCRPTHR